jgi:NAD(P)-dependent dehydrogenase (short-subunit alcohol dehydrogenase family)
MRGLEGKTAIVTGGSSGIGQAIAIRLGQEGMNVAVNYVGQPEGAEATKDAIDRGNAVKRVVVERDGQREEFSADVIAVSCGAINSAALLLASANEHHPSYLGDVYLVDSSFFVSSSSVNPTLTIIANALRVADHLRARLG